MKKLIIAPTDFSPAAGSGVRYAFMLAKKLGADIRLCHAIVSTLSESTALAQLKALACSMSENLRQFSGDYEPDTDFVLTQSIAGLAASLGKCLPMSIIVIGTSGNGYQRGGWTGRDGSKILHSAVTFVLLVPPAATIRLPKNITFATTMDKKDHGTLISLAALAQDLGAEITIVHADTGSYDHESRKNKWIGFIDKGSDDITGLPHFTYLSIPGNKLAAGLSDIITNESTDLLVVGREIYSQLSSLSIAGNLSIPLMIAPSPIQ